MINRIKFTRFAQCAVAIVVALGLVACGGSSAENAPDPAPVSLPPNSASVPTPSDADLVLTVTTGASQHVIVGEPIFLGVTVTNTGGRPATGVQFTDDLGLELDVVWAVSAGGFCSHAPIFTCQLPDLAPQDATEVFFITVGRTTGSLVQRVLVKSNEADADSSTNQADIVTTVVPDPHQVAHAVAIPSSAVIAVGDTVSLSVVRYAPDGVPEPTGSTPVWISSAEPVATVSPTGVVTGIALGAAEVTARIDGVTSQPVLITVAETAQPRNIDFAEEPLPFPPVNIGGGPSTIVRPVRTWLPGVGFDVEIDQARHAAYISMPTRRAVAVLDLATFAQQEISVNGTPYGLAISPDGATLFVALAEGDVGAVDLEDFAVRYFTPYVDSSGYASPFDIAAANGYLYVTSRSSESRSLRVMNADGSPRGYHWDWWNNGPATSPGATLLVTPDGERLYVLEIMSRVLSVFNLSTPLVPQVRSVWALIHEIDRMQVALGDNEIYLGNGEVRRRDLFDLVGIVSPGVPALNHDGTRVLVGTYNGFFATDGDVVEHDATTFEAIASQRVGCAPQRLLPAVDQEHFLILGFDAVCLWRHIPTYTYTFDWPGDLNIEPLPHPSGGPVLP